MSSLNCYRADTTTAAYSLRWSWTGWPSLGSMPNLSEDDWRTLEAAWEQDGIRLLERRCQSDYWQATVSTKPSSDPSLIVARLKGRIDHRFRSQKIPFKFSRKVSLRAIGRNTTADVQDYIHRQVDSSQFCSSFTRRSKLAVADTGTCFIWCWSSMEGIGSATSIFWGTYLRLARLSQWIAAICWEDFLSCPTIFTYACVAQWLTRRRRLRLVT